MVSASTHPTKVRPPRRNAIVAQAKAREHHAYNTNQSPREPGLNRGYVSLSRPVPLAFVNWLRRIAVQELAFVPKPDTNEGDRQRRQPVGEEDEVGLARILCRWSD